MRNETSLDSSKIFWFLLRRISFLLRIIEALSMAYIMCKKSDMGNNNNVVLRLIGKLMGWSNIRYIYALIVPLIHIEQTSNVCSDDYKVLNYVSKNTIVFNQKKKKN